MAPPNTPDGFAAVVDCLGAEQHGATLHVVLEPARGYEPVPTGFACRQGWLVSLTNPKQMRDWARDSGWRAKSDTPDTVVLAQYGAERQPIWRPPAAEVAALEGLLRCKDDVGQLIRQERNRQRALVARPGPAAAIPATIAGPGPSSAARRDSTPHGAPSPPSAPSRQTRGLVHVPTRLPLDADESLDWRGWPLLGGVGVV